MSRAIWQRKANALSVLGAEQMHIVAPSKWIQREAQASALFSRFPVTVIPLGLDANVFFPCDGEAMKSALGISKNVSVVLFAADSITKRRKGFSELVQALNALTLEEEIFRLTIGGSEPELGGKFRHLHLRYVNNDRLMAVIYSAANVFIIPSMQEAFGQLALE